MPKKKSEFEIVVNKRVFPPATSDEARESQLITLAYDLAEQQLRNGTASSQVIHDFLKLGSKKERLERDILEEQKKLVIAKTENLESSKRLEEVYIKAVEAMKRYQGVTDESEEFYS